MFLLDTVAVSDLNKSRPNRGFAAWFDATDDHLLFVSVVTFAEIERGIERQRAGAPDFARRLETWQNRIVEAYASRILPVNVGIARTWGRLAERGGYMNANLLIAATAIEHELAVVTRNVRRFEGTGAKVLNPFDG